MTEATTSKVLYSPLAQARWAHLVQPRPQMDPDKPLAWSVDLVLPAAEPQTQAFQQQLEEAFLAEHGSRKRRSDKGFPLKPDKLNPELLVAKFKAQQLLNRDGTPAPGPRLIDARKQPWDGSAIGNGSRLIVAFRIYPWDRPEGCGISLILKAAQVVQFVPYTQQDPTEGFAEQEGYAVAAASLSAGRDGDQDEFGDGFCSEEVPF